MCFFKMCFFKSEPWPYRQILTPIFRYKKPWKIFLIKELKIPAPIQWMVWRNFANFYLDSLATTSCVGSDLSSATISAVTDPFSIVPFLKLPTTLTSAMPGQPSPGSTINASSAEVTRLHNSANSRQMASVGRRSFQMRRHFEWASHVQGVVGRAML